MAGPATMQPVQRQPGSVQKGMCPESQLAVARTARLEYAPVPDCCRAHTAIDAKQAHGSAAQHAVTGRRQGINFLVKGKRQAQPAQRGGAQFFWQIQMYLGPGR